MIQNVDLKDCLLRINDVTIINDVLDLVQTVLSDLSEPPNSQKLAFKARSNKRIKTGVDRPLNFSFNNLVVISLFAENDSIYCQLLIDESDSVLFGSNFTIKRPERGSGNSKSYWIVFPADEIQQIYKAPFYQKWMDKCKYQLQQAYASPYVNTRTEELHRLVENVDFREKALLTLFPNTNKKSMNFFQFEDLQFYKNLVETDSRYRNDNPELKKNGERIKTEIFDKTNYWGRLVAEKAQDFEFQPDNRWNISGNIKSYSWARFKSKDFPSGKIYITIGVGTNPLGLLYKIDCQRQGPTKLSDAEINTIDNFLSDKNIQQTIIPIEEINKYDWDILADQTSKFINDNLLLFKELNSIIENKKHNPQLKTLKPKVALNTILYGPPGTGKTYHTINKALQIIDPVFYEANKMNRSELTTKFKKLLIQDWDKDAGQIAFTTFHQSMSYEDFVEGIKPVRPDSAATIHYEIVDGIFKKLCSTATRKSHLTVSVDGIEKELTKELFEEFYYSYSNTLPDQKELSSEIRLFTKENYEFELFKNSAESIVVKAGTKKYPMSLAFSELSAVLFNKKDPTYKSYEEIVINEILKDKSLNESFQDNSQKKFVLIIDEINRGNVSQIFGELITLIEDDKRTGKEEEITVNLPYSKKSFSVPKNLFIVGTMNTADRSVEALDTALRRRFSFEEMVPRADFLSSQNLLCNFWNKKEHIKTTYQEWMKEPFYSKATKFYDLLGFGRNKEKNVHDQEYSEDRENWIPADLHMINDGDFNGINFQELLIKINTRLEKLLTKDHLIGHAFFINVRSQEELYNAFYQKVIPQLQEYFYGDFGKIGLIIGAAFVSQETNKSQTDFAVFDYEDAHSLSEKNIYSINDFVNGHIDYPGFLKAIKSIYS